MIAFNKKKMKESKFTIAKSHFQTKNNWHHRAKAVCYTTIRLLKPGQTGEKRFGNNNERSKAHPPSTRATEEEKETMEKNK